MSKEQFKNLNLRPDALATIGTADNIITSYQQQGYRLTLRQKYNPPLNPAKITDPRAKAYIAQHGNSSWEVDALPPNVLVRLIRSAFKAVIDKPAMDAVIVKEETDKAALLAATKKVT